MHLRDKIDVSAGDVGNSRRKQFAEQITEVISETFALEKAPNKNFIERAKVTPRPVISTMSISITVRCVGNVNMVISIRGQVEGYSEYFGLHEALSRKSSCIRLCCIGKPVPEPSVAQGMASVLLFFFPDIRINGAVFRRTFSELERFSYLAAVRCLQAIPAKSKATVPGAVSRFDDFAGNHILQTDTVHFVVSLLSRI